MNSNLIVLGVLLIGISPIILMIALGVRNAGGRRIINAVDYDRVISPGALHKWAGNRLVLLAILSGVLGWAGMKSPGCAVLAVLLFLIGTLVVGVWISLGAESFCDRSGK